LEEDLVEPKIFYRKLDFMLNTIGNETKGKDFLFVIVSRLESTFGKDLNFINGRIYEEYEGGYELATNTNGQNNISSHIASDSVPLQSLLKNKCYIFNDQTFTIDRKIKANKDYTIAAALTVESPDNKWLFIFDLKSGWIREEIEFCFNAVRTVLNFRLYSEAVKNEMQQASNIQKSLLPSSFPQPQGYQIAGRTQPAELVGGDLYDFYNFNQNSFGISIGDASGHGMPAALLVRDAVTGLRMGLEGEPKFLSMLDKIGAAFSKKTSAQRMTGILENLNRVIYKSVYSSRFISLCLAEFDTEGNISYVNAGHPQPLIITADKTTELISTGLIFGALPEIELQSAEAYLEKGGVLVLYSDGIIERMDSNSEEFGIERLKKLVQKNVNKSAKEIINIIFDIVHDFGQRPDWEDDATVVIIKKV
jgi:sigma-B regulation protein RsbU (phosphoserine phosphatase)